MSAARKAEFEVKVSLWTPEGADAACHPEKLRFLFGEAMEKLGLQEEVDFTLEVRRIHDYKGRLNAAPASDMRGEGRGVKD